MNSGMLLPVHMHSEETKGNYNQQHFDDYIATTRWRVSCLHSAVCELSVCLDGPNARIKYGGRHTRTLTQCTAPSPPPQCFRCHFINNPAVVPIKKTAIVFRNITLPADIFIFHGRLSTLRIICVIIICIMQMFPLVKCISLLWYHTSAVFFKQNLVILQLFNCHVLEVTDNLPRFNLFNPFNLNNDVIMLSFLCSDI